jgi:hypothetical protein
MNNANKVLRILKQNKDFQLLPETINFLNDLIAPGATFNQKGWFNRHPGTKQVFSPDAR